MKLAIVGSGPLAIYCAHHFDQMNADVTLFHQNTLGGNISFLLEEFPQMEIQYQNKNLTLKSFWEENLQPLIVKIGEQQITKLKKVIRVQKKFLHHQETVLQRSRLHDLFRVVYATTEGEESYDDFDIVILAQGLEDDIPFYALNTKNIKDLEKILYQKNVFSKLNLDGKKHVVVVGEGDALGLTLLKLQTWLFLNTSHTIALITHLPFYENFKNCWVKNEVLKLMELIKIKREEEIVIFDKKIQAYKELEDYVQVKTPKPMEPLSKLNIYQGYDVMALDQFVDREEIFVTVESPDFRAYATSLNDLKSFAADLVLVSSDQRKSKETIGKGLILGEPGFYHLQASDLDLGLLKIQEIEKEILNFFKRA